MPIGDFFSDAYNWIRDPQNRTKLTAVSPLAGIGMSLRDGYVVDPNTTSELKKSFQRIPYSSPAGWAESAAWMNQNAQDPMAGMNPAVASAFPDRQTAGLPEAPAEPHIWSQQLMDWAQQRRASIPDEIQPAERYRGKVWDDPSMFLDPAWHASKLPEGVAQTSPSLLPMLASRNPAVTMPLAFGIGGAQEAGPMYAEAVRRGVDDPLQKSNAGFLAVGLLNSLTPSLRNPLASAAMEQFTEQAEEPTQALIMGDDPVQAIKDSFDIGLTPALVGGTMTAASNYLNPEPETDTAAQDYRRAIGYILGASPGQVYSKNPLAQAVEQQSSGGPPGAPPAAPAVPLSPVMKEAPPFFAQGIVPYRKMIPDPDATPLDVILGSPILDRVEEEMRKIPETINDSSPERVQLREQVITELYGQGASAKERRAWLILGPPASGKSWVADPIAEQNGAIIIDADMAKEKLPEFQGGIGANAVHEESKDITASILAQAVNNGDNIVHPIVGGKIEKIRATLQMLEENGYDVGVRLMALPADVATQRAIKRYINTGRYVSHNYLIGEVGESPMENYLEMVRNGEFKNHEAYSNNVPFGQDPTPLDEAGVQALIDESRSRRHRFTGSGEAAETPVFNGKQQEVVPQRRQFAPEIPQVRQTKDGRYYGAPGGKIDESGVQSLVGRLSQMATHPLALPEQSQNWYKQGGTAIRNLTRGNLEEAERMARIAALMSADTGIGTNVAALIDAAQNYVRGQDFERGYGRYPNAKKDALNAAIKAKEFNKALPGVSNKVMSFYRNLMSEISENPQWDNEVTMDMQMFRAMGYPGKSERFLPSQYAFGREVMGRVADQLTEQMGRPVKPREAQAMIWTYIRNAQKEGNKSFMPSNEGFETYLDRGAAVVPFETIAYPSVGSFPQEVWQSMPEDAKREFTNAAASLLKDQNGNDILLQAMGAPALYQTTEGTGTFEGEMTPNEVTYMVLPRINGEIDGRMANAYAAAVGYIYKQKAVGWWRAAKPGTVKAGDSMPGAHIVVQSGTFTPAQMRDLALEEGLDFTYYQRPDGRFGYEIIDFNGFSQPQKPFMERIEKLTSRMPDDVSTVTEPFRAVGNYIEQDWEVDSNGQAYREAIASAGFPDLQERVDGVRSNFDPLEAKAVQRFSGQQEQQIAAQSPPFGQQLDLSSDSRLLLDPAELRSLPMADRNKIQIPRLASPEEQALLSDAVDLLESIGFRTDIAGMKIGLGSPGNGWAGVYAPDVSAANVVADYWLKEEDTRESAVRKAAGTLVHEIHHGIDNLAARALGGGVDHVLTSSSPLLAIGDLSYSKDGARVMIGHKGPVMDEALRAWSQGFGPLGELLNYPFFRMESLVTAWAMMGRAGSESLRGAWQRKYEDWVRFMQSEVFAQLGEAYHMHPEIRSRMPATAQLFAEVDDAIQSGTIDADGVRAALGATYTVSLVSGSGGPSFNRSEGAGDRRGAGRTATANGPNVPGDGGGTSTPGDGPGLAPSGPTGGGGGGYNLGQSRGERTVGNLNLDKMQLTEEQAQIFETIGQAFGQEIEAARRGTVTWDESQAAAAAQIAKDINVPLGQLLKRPKGRVPNVEELFQYRAILKAQNDIVHQAAVKAKETGAHQDLMDLQAELGKLAALQAPIQGDIAELGRAFGSLRAMVGETANAEDALRLAYRGKDPMETAERIAALRDGELAAFARKAMEPTAWQQFMEVWINSLLSGITTHAVNITSNFVYAIQEQWNNYLAAAGDTARGERGAFRAANARMAGMVEGAFDGAKLALRAFLTEEPSDATQKIEAARYRAIPGRAGKIIRVPGRLLMAEDEFFKAIAYRAELAKAAHEIAQEEGLTGDEYSERVRAVKSDPPNDVRAAAKDMAAKLTFTKPLGSYGKAAQKVVQYGALRMVVPFFRTPTNILKSAIENSVAAPLMQHVRDDLMGRNGKKAQDLQAARMLTGTAISTAVVMMALEGLITGAGPDDPNKKGLMYANGWQPYSIKIGNKWYRYNRLEPLGMLFGVSADMTEIYKDYPSLEGLDEVSALILGSVTRNLTDKTWLRGASEVLDAVNDPERYGERYVQNLLGTSVPTLVAQISRSQDPILREVDGILQQLKSRTTLSKQLPPKVDVFGQPIDTGASIGNLFSPIKAVTNPGPDPLASEMLRLDIIKGKPGKKVNNVELSAEEYSAYSEYMGRNLKMQLEPIIRSPQYRALPDEVKAQTLDNLWNKLSNDLRQRYLYQNPALLLEGQRLREEKYAQ